MWRSVVFKAIVGAYIAWGAWNWYRDRPIHPSDGILAPGEPLQVDSNAQPSRRIGRWTLTPRASYRITARILHTQRYHFDFLATLIPEDLALGWGPMSDNRILDTMNISQSNRFYYWRSPQHAALAKEAIISHSANTHVIPGNSPMAVLLGRLRPGQVVTLSGMLVDARRDDGAWVKTSLVRTDTGAGACEVMLVNDLSILQ